MKAPGGRPLAGCRRGTFQSASRDYSSSHQTMRAARTGIALLVGISLSFFAVQPAGSTPILVFESRTVPPGQTGVQIYVRAYWGFDMQLIAVPMVIRSIDPGSFWTGQLPYWYSSTRNHGVQWNWSNPGWADWVEVIDTGVNRDGCNRGAEKMVDGAHPAGYGQFVGYEVHAHGLQGPGPL